MRTVAGPMWRSAGVRAPWPLWVAAAAVALAAALPVAYLAFRGLGGGGEAYDSLLRARTAAILLRTLLLVAIVTGATVALAVPLAWLTTRTDMPFRRTLSVASALPLVVPSYVAGMVAVVTLGPKGMLQTALSPLGVDRLPDIYGLPGAALVLVLLTYPYVLLTVRAALYRLDPVFEEASRSLGIGPIRTFWSVTVPLLRPGVSAGALLAALYTLSDFGAVSLLRFETFTWAIFVQYETAFDRSVAASLSMVLVAVAMGILLIDLLTTGRGRQYRSGGGASRQPLPVLLGKWRWPAAAFVATPALLGVVAPVIVLVYWLARGIGAGEPLEFVWSATRNSLWVALLAALATLAAAAPIAILAVRFRGRASAALERVSYLGFALPGIVIALALVFVGIKFARPLYQTTSLLIFAYLILFLPAAVGALRTSLAQVSPRLEEAAQVLGRSHWRALTSVTLPLVLPGALAGAAMVFLLTMKELPATLILSPIGFESLATSIWSAASEAFFARAAAPALILILAAGPPTAFLVLRGRGRSSRDGVRQQPANLAARESAHAEAAAL